MTKSGVISGVFQGELSCQICQLELMIIKTVKFAGSCIFSKMEGMSWLKSSFKVG